jgi:hypothetical protein
VGATGIEGGEEEKEDQGRSDAELATEGVEVLADDVSN